jgi:hypothetical protein
MIGRARCTSGQFVTQVDEKRIVLYVEPLFDDLKRCKIRGEGFVGWTVYNMFEGGTVDVLKELRPVSTGGAYRGIQVPLDHTVTNKSREKKTHNTRILTPNPFQRYRRKQDWP